MAIEAHDKPLRPGDVAELFGVTPKTVQRWAASGVLASFRTAGGHLRFKRTDVDDLLEATYAPVGYSSLPERTPEPTTG